MKKTAVFCAIFMLAWSAALAAESRETLTLPVAGLKALAIDCGAGGLKVQGREGLERIEVVATLRLGGVSEAELRDFRKERVTLNLEKKGAKAVLTALIDESCSLGKLLAGKSPLIDLDVSLPRALDLEVDDGSGDLEIRDIGGRLDLEDGSGGILVERIAGAVEIEDGSGGMILEGLRNDLKIDDGSGDIAIRDAGGAVAIEDGSGSIDIRDAVGPVTIDDGSGDIVIDGVERDVTIEEAGSGGLEIRNVKGKVKK